MNIALTILFIFIFLLPGIIFRRFYYTEEFSKEYFKQSFFEVLLSCLIPSIFFHVSWYYLVQIIGFKVDLVLLGQLLTAHDSNIQALLNINQNFGKITVYHFSLFLIAGAAGTFSKLAVRNLGWDRKFKLFRFQNSWHYILKGEFFEFPRATFSLEEVSSNFIEFTYVDALVNTNQGTIIYDGILVDYDLSNDSGLEKIYLKHVQRRYLKDDTGSDIVKSSVDKSEEIKKGHYYSIPGHILILPYSEILNLNFSFYKIDYDKEENPQVVLVK